MHRVRVLVASATILQSTVSLSRRSPERTHCPVEVPLRPWRFAHRSMPTRFCGVQYVWTLGTSTLSGRRKLVRASLPVYLHVKSPINAFQLMRQKLSETSFRYPLFTLTSVWNNTKNFYSLFRKTVFYSVNTH